ncbi:MAG: adenylate/guanylate cyclase domain-containing protein [Saprospiraceae bacterium]|nr:adenylate/guanylate cyclase domain-containing protein [Saprospiraceae bacterium]MCB9323773.1 adenylate/guanylate cyclase domain-containing protein [Lewinellaceae bacterium]
MRILNIVRLKIKGQRVAWITIGWTMAALLDNINTRTIGASRYIEVLPDYEFNFVFNINIFSAFLAGIISGSLLIFYLRERFRKASFGYAILINALIISALNVAISALSYTLFIAFKLGLGLFHPEVLELSSRLIQDTMFYKKLLFWFFLVMLTIIGLHVNEKYGQGILGKLIMGKYLRPREEERIFMFVDIRSSTTIAEQLGHLRFFELLNDFYRDLTNPIIYKSGEIYQYVGDEIVVSWPMKEGLHNASCLRCFYDIKATLETLSGEYKKKYGLVPVVKAGLHCGLVTTGEIGVIKKDIVFSGDVMNTTSRIQAQCNRFGVDILLSKTLLDKLKLPPDEFPRKRVGMIELRGRRQKVELYSFGDEEAEVEMEKRMTRRRR